MAETSQYAAPERRPRCSPQNFDVIGEMIMFGIEDAYNNDEVPESTKETK